MTYDQAGGALVTLRQAMRECADHGAVAIVDGLRDALDIYDASSEDGGAKWGAVRIVRGNYVSARAVLSVLGY